ncbi:MAG: isochorismatase family protein, partial [Gammaproteobacteria bacterium]
MRNILILIDIQKEYTSSNRSFYLKGIHPSLDNCKSLLTKARQLDWSIVHVKHLADESSSTFNPKEEFSQFAVGFEPKQGELVFIKNDRSCFTCKDFKDFIEKHKSDDIYVIGYNTPMCILSTMVYAKNE